MLCQQGPIGKDIGTTVITWRKLTRENYNITCMMEASDSHFVYYS